MAPKYWPVIKYAFVYGEEKSENSTLINSFIHIKWLAFMNSRDFRSSLNILTQFKYVFYNGILILKIIYVFSLVHKFKGPGATQLTINVLSSFKILSSFKSQTIYNS